MLTHILIVDGDASAAGGSVCADMLMDTPVTPPATANTTLASGKKKSKQKNKIQQKIHS